MQATTQTRVSFSFSARQCLSYLCALSPFVKHPARTDGQSVFCLFSASTCASLRRHDPFVIFTIPYAARCCNTSKPKVLNILRTLHNFFSFRVLCGSYSAVPRIITELLLLSVPGRDRQTVCYLPMHPAYREHTERLLPRRSIGISPPRLLYGRAANHGSIIVLCPGPRFRHKSVPAADPAGEVHRECIRWMSIRFSRFSKPGQHIGNWKFWQAICPT